MATRESAGVEVEVRRGRVGDRWAEADFDGGCARCWGVEDAADRDRCAANVVYAPTRHSRSGVDFVKRIRGTNHA